MSEYTAIIIEDEPPAMELIERYIRDHCKRVQVVGKATYSEEAQDLIEEKNPEIVFLDILLPGKNGLETIDCYHPKPFVTIVLTGSKPKDYVAEMTVDQDVCAYLQKPIKSDQFKKAVKKACYQVDVLKSKEVSKKFVIPAAENRVEETKDLLYLKADDFRTIFVMGYGEVITCKSKPLKHFTPLFCYRKDFTRISRSYVVNNNHIQRYSNSKNGDVIMNDNLEIAYGQTYAERAIEKLNRYFGGK